MAGGTFDTNIGKERPGTYINFEGTQQDTIGSPVRGIVFLPLINHDYGPAKEFISITSESPNAAMSKLGYSIYDSNPSLLMIREAFKNASEVIAYIPRQGARATVTAGALTATARYGGQRGNALKFSVVASPVSGYDVSIYLDTVVVTEYEGLSTIEELIAQENPWIEFAGTGNLTETAGVTLAGGTTGTASNADITAMVDDSENRKWNTMAFPIEATGEEGDTVPALYETVKSKIKYLRDSVGKYRKAVIPGFYADYEGIINVTNSVKLSDGTELTKAQVTAWVAGADAGASNTESNTNKAYSGAVDIIGAKNHTEAVEAIKKGEFIFSWSENSVVVVEYDINSLVSFTVNRSKDYRKNRVLRVYDTFAEAVMINFPPNKYDNSEDGWGIMEGMGKAILKEFEDARAIKNVDYDNDFLVDRQLSAGDQTFFNIGLEAVDSAEKLYFSIKTR